MNYVILVTEQPIYPALTPIMVYCAINQGADRPARRSRLLLPPMSLLPETPLSARPPADFIQARALGNSSLTRHSIEYLLPAAGMTANLSFPAAAAGFQPQELTWLEVVIEVIGFFFATIGALANLVLVYIYFSKKQRKPTEVLILCLGCLDLTYCICNDIVQILIIMMKKGQISPQIWEDVIEVILNFLFNALPFMSWLMMLNITCNRYMAVCRPFVYQRVYTASFSHKVALSIVLGSILISLPIAFERSPLLRDHEIRPHYQVIRSCLVGVVCFTMLTMYSLVIAKLRHQSRHSMVNQAQMVQLGEEESEADTTATPSASARRISQLPRLIGRSIGAVSFVARPATTTVSTFEPAAADAPDGVGHKPSQYSTHLAVNAENEEHEGESYACLKFHNQPTSSTIVPASPCPQRRSRGGQQHMPLSTTASSSHQRARKTTLVLCCVSSAFLLLNLPNASIRMLKTFTQHDVSLFVNDLSLILYTMSFAVNPFIYFLSNPKFKDDVLAIKSQLARKLPSCRRSS